MMLKRRTRPKMGIRQTERIRSAGHLAWVRGFVCVCFASGDCDGRIEAHHDRQGGTGGTGLKPGDDKAIPLCAKHHAEGDMIGWHTWSAKYKVDIAKEAAKLWRLSPHRRKLEAAE